MLSGARSVVGCRPREGLDWTGPRRLEEWIGVADWMDVDVWTWMESENSGRKEAGWSCTIFFFFPFLPCARRDGYGYWAG